LEEEGETKNLEKTKLKIVGITFNQVQAGAYALILAEEQGNRRIPIIIGTPEAQSIAIFLENLRPPRPLTHDLFASFINLVHIILKEVNIYKYEEGIFHSEMIFNDGKNDIFLDSRTSDAIALALRVNAPIFMANDIMKEVAVELDEDDINDNAEQVPPLQSASLDSLGPEKLQKLLNEAIGAENYEKASYIRDLIKEKKKRQ
jgi:bifunctional DNase/RNase